MSSVRLSTTSYVVLGLVEMCEPVTPYELKQTAEMSTANFWTVAHTQLYGECARLAREGLLDEQQEPGGRRRKLYRLTEAGRRALDLWREAPVAERGEVRDPGALKLALGADPTRLAQAQLRFHEAQLSRYLEYRKLEMSEGMRLALEAGIGHEREYIRFWRKLAE
ncbi:MAG TPA: PadR family transcriptional regulator [Solirubrobacteraceae bacterium]|jgi:DNA-binding PadR family transcriptional regulator